MSDYSPTKVGDILRTPAWVVEHATDHLDLETENFFRDSSGHTCALYGQTIGEEKRQRERERKRLNRIRGAA